MISSKNSHEVCETAMLNEGNKILRYCYRQKPLKIPFATYVDFEKIFEKTCTCANNPKT